MQRQLKKEVKIGNLKIGGTNQMCIRDRLTKPAVTQVLQEIGKMDLKPQPAVLVLVPVPEETAARRALGLFSRYEIMLRPYGMKNLFDEIYRMGTDEEENRLYRLRRCCEDCLLYTSRCV